MHRQTQSQVDLETKIAFLERISEELSEVILDQGRDIQKLEERLTRMESRAAASQEAQGEEPGLADQRPPHY